MDLQLAKYFSPTNRAIRNSLYSPAKGDSVLRWILQVISLNYISQLLPQKKLEIFADENHEMPDPRPECTNLDKSSTFVTGVPNK